MILTKQLIEPNSVTKACRIGSRIRSFLHTIQEYRNEIGIHTKRLNPIPELKRFYSHYDVHDIIELKD